MKEAKTLPFCLTVRIVFIPYIENYVLTDFHTDWSESNTKTLVEKTTEIDFFEWQFKFPKNSSSKIKVILYEDTHYENLKFLFDMLRSLRHRRVSEFSV